MEFSIPNLSIYMKAYFLLWAIKIEFAEGWLFNSPPPSSQIEQTALVETEEKNTKETSSSSLKELEQKLFAQIYLMAERSDTLIGIIDEYMDDLEETERNYYVGDSLSVLEQVDIDVIYNLAQNNLDIVSAYHQALSNESRKFKKK